MEINKIRKGDILITEETRFGMRRYVYGTVVIIDYERNTIGIETKTEEGIRSFPPKQLSTIYNFVNNCRARQSLSDEEGLKTFIVSLADGQIDNSTLREIAEEFKKQGVKPVAPQDALEALLC